MENKTQNPDWQVRLMGKWQARLYSLFHLTKMNTKFTSTTCKEGMQNEIARDIINILETYKSLAGPDSEVSH